MTEKKHKHEIDKNIEKGDDFEIKYLRALADYQNLLKQTAKEKMDFARYANESLLQDIIPVYDHLKMSVNYGNETDQWLAGIKHVVNQFKKVLAEAGVLEIEAVGKKFDHNTMEAVETEETTEAEKDELVIRELQTGYTLNGKVIIPARVVVYKLK